MFIGTQPKEAFSTIAKQDITGNGGTSYTLNATVTSPEDIELFINHVRQEPTASYSVSGTTLTLTEALASTDDCYVVYQGRTVATKAPGDNTVGTSKIQANAITEAKLGDLAVTPAKMHSTLDLSSKNLTMPSGHMIQMQYYQSTPPYQEVSSTSYVEVTGMNVTITPKSTTSKILISAEVSWWLSTDANNYMFLTFFRSIGGGAFTNMSTSSPYAALHFYHPGRHATYNTTAHLTYVDEPNTSSQVVYKLYCRRYDGTNNVRLKYAQTNSLMTAIEVK